MSKFADLKKRFLFSTGVIATLSVLLFYAHTTLASLLLLVLVCGLSYLCMKEYLFLAKAKLIELQDNYLLIGALLLPLSFFLAAKGAAFALFPWWLLFFLVFGCFLLSFKKIENSFTRVAVSVLSFLYIALPLGMVISILFTSPFGRFWVLYLIAVTKMTDIAAYFGGRLLGKRLLAPHLSPKKTWEGAFCGMFLGTLTGVMLGLLQDNSLEGIIRYFFLSLVISTLGQLGDLAESLFKRDAHTKDSSSIPGVGGMLDMMDSLLLTIPVIYLYLR